MQKDIAFRITEVDAALFSTCKNQYLKLYLHAVRCLAATARMIAVYPEKEEQINMWTSEE